MTKIEGLIAATFSTFNAEGALDLKLVPRVVDRLVSDGLRGVFVCGTNGEGPSLTIQERMAVAETYVKAAKGRLLVMVHVGHSSVEECRRLAAHAQEIGADAISAVAAFYFKPSSVANLVDSMAKIASAAPNLPFYYYHIPALTGVGLDMVEFLRMGGTRIPNLAGIKYTAATIHEYQACVNYDGGKFDILYGYDELLLPALVVGAKGAVGSTYNYAAPLYLQVMADFSAGRLREAQKRQLLLVNMIREMTQYPAIPAQKAIMSMIGLDLGPCRLPLQKLKTGDTEALRKALDAIGFFDTLTAHHNPATG